MRKVIATAVISLGMLYAQTASANEMVNYDHSLFLADASMPSTTQGGAEPVKKSNAKSARRHHRYHSHKHHSRHRNDDYDCPYSSCNQPVYMPQHGSGMVPTLEQVENNMDIIDRDHAARAAGGRGR